MKLGYLFLLFILASCMPDQQAPRKPLSSETDTPSDPDNNHNSTPSAQTQWNYLSSLSLGITLDASNLNNAYIAGEKIENFLGRSDHFTQDYCLVARYLISGSTKELRSRVVPVSYYDFTAKKTKKLFRVDFNDLTNSQNECAGIPLMVLDANQNYIANPVNVALSTHDPSQICSQCTSLMTSSKLLFFKKSSMDLKELPLSQIDIRALTLSIDPNNRSQSSSGTCSQSSCQGRGYSCCLENQCVSDGSVRSSALVQYASQVQIAEQERLSNPLAYLNYPHLYYICGHSVPSTTAGSNGGNSYEQGLTQLKKDYFCLEHLKRFKTGATFHQDLLSSTSFFDDDPDIPDVPNNPSTLYPLDIECRDDTDVNSNMYYKKVAERLYQNCGCAQTTLANMVALCPQYDYRVNFFESSGLPNRIDCMTPPTHVPQVPSQQTVSVNSKSAPHRYFRTCGDEFGTSTPCSSGNNQEGDVFNYIDDARVFPSQENFGMNSILGQMTVALDKAQPAKMVAVELDQVYQISTTSGFYNPCPTCSKDSWFSSFSAHPSSAWGVGLQAIGHSTSRDSFDRNTTGGNYEDTIFGRACWLPPTMIPFSHSPYSTVHPQRLNRLKTQAALYINGYQRDWYGFNKGALIGSFDGVTWFAVGKGRIVRSTSTKLFLAINAPFADLASATIHSVNVQAYDGITQMAQVDYDPQYHLSHPYQNEAGNCQANHLCSTDTDCITRLGWEYMCADVQNLKTQFPSFDSNGNERANVSSTVTLDQILQQKRFPSSSTKRCVYRGAGALCVREPSLITPVLNDYNKRKLFACAPNFYCADLTQANFNSKISRFGGNIEDIPLIRNHLFGQDANVLGRPLHYVGQTDTLPSEAQLAITQSLNGNGLNTVNTPKGLCMPGKALPESSNQISLSNPFEQHKNRDPSRRADFISQIASCNSGLFSSYRYSSCPVLKSNGDYEFLSSSFSLTDYAQRARNQNSCGLDSLQIGTSLAQSADALLSSSPFRAIEAKTLSAQTISAPTLARDACLRRAGQVCHTDLDCGPNKLHADQAENFSLAYFGNEAEKKYYTEYLVCGQTDPKPSPTDTLNYQAYEMNKNRCCREVGSDLTTYTAHTPLSINPNSASNQNASTSDDTYDRVSFGLNMSLMPGTDPQNQFRYSRLATVERLGSSDRPYLSAYQDKSGSTISTATQNHNMMTPYQWKTLSEANSESCCGGGWVRKFSDGTNDWTKRNRLYLDVSNFACINSRSVLLTNPGDVAGQYNSASDVQTLINQDYGDYCKDSLGVKGSCAQYTISDSLIETPPVSDPIIQFTFGQEATYWKSANINFSSMTDYYFYPRSADSNSEIIIDNSLSSGRRNISIKIPSYITRTSWEPTQIVQLYEIGNESNAVLCSFEPGLFNALTTPTTVSNCPTSPLSKCCYEYQASTRILKVVPHSGESWNPSSGPTKIGVRLPFAVAAGTGITRQKPGTNSYYLRRLGKLELSGIPQIPYEALTCSDNADRIIPGIFTGFTDMRIGDFNNNNYSFQHTLFDPDTSVSFTTRYTNFRALNHEPIFSSQDFKCCTPLGKKTTDQSKCCSGYGTTSSGSGSTYTCALPAGANLMVYFNRYVSNEGVGADKPGGGLVESDFDFITGAPKLKASVNQKISALGLSYCASGKVRQGGAFGSFRLQPDGNDTNQNERIYGIVDSSRDEGQLSNAGGTVSVGYTAFMSGFRWNHHLYCDD